jgi:hypothetical protein
MTQRNDEGDATVRSRFTSVSVYPSGTLPAQSFTFETARSTHLQTDFGQQNGNLA